MEMRMYRTTIYGNVSNWAFGRIARVMDLICKDPLEVNKGYSAYSIVWGEGDKFDQICFTQLAVFTDQERYDRFVAQVKDVFPNLSFEFDVKE